MRLPNKIYHGAAYYPETWDRKTILQDIEYMKQLGINVVRMGEFCWSLLEPDEDIFNIAIFDEVIELLAKNGIDTIMCTPTATPPRWLTKKYPECLYLDRWGNRAHHGSREHVCFNDPDYIRRTKIIVTKLAEHYGENPHVIAWQLHNEYNCPPVNECVCDNCEKEYRVWLKKKYGTIENLNKEWDSAVWSTGYNSFEDVIAPRPTPNGHSASMSTNYTLFTFDSVAKYNKMQADILKKYVKVPLTHNSNKCFHYDQQDIFNELDFVSFDDYTTQERYQELCFEVERNRCLKVGVPFYEMETAISSSANLHGGSLVHKPGFVKAEAVNQFFAGSQGFSYWLFRQHRGGTEMPHAHLVNAFGTLSFATANVLDVKGAIEELSPFLLSTKPKQAEVALMYSDKGRAFVGNETLQGNNYLVDMVETYSALLTASTYRDIIYEQNSLDGYKVIIIPYIYNLSDELVNKIYDAANKGATVLVGPYSGWRTSSHNYYEHRCFGPLEDRLATPILDGEHMLGQDATYKAFGLEEKLTRFACIIEKGIGEVSGGYFNGKSLIGETPVGKGKVVFIGSKFTRAMQDKLYQHFINEKVSKKIEAEEGIMIYERADDHNEYLCLVNMSFDEKKYSLNGSYVDYKSGKEVKEGTLRSNGYVILKRI